MWILWVFLFYSKHSVCKHFIVNHCLFFAKWFIGFREYMLCFFFLPHSFMYLVFKVYLCGLLSFLVWERGGSRLGCVKQFNNRLRLLFCSCFGLNYYLHYRGAKSSCTTNSYCCHAKPVLGKRCKWGKFYRSLRSYLSIYPVGFISGNFADTILPDIRTGVLIITFFQMKLRNRYKIYGDRSALLKKL